MSGKTLVWIAAAVLVASTGTARARDLSEILQKKGVISEAEAREVKKVEAPSGTLRVFWKHGLNLASKDGQFHLKIGGRIQNDWALIAPSDALSAAFPGKLDSPDTGTEFRRARLYIAGTVYDNVEFKAQYDFAGGNAVLKDMYIGLKKVPLLSHVRVGHFKEPFSLEELTSSKYMTFMERALPNDFAPSRNTGIAIFKKGFDGRATWAIGAFRETGSTGRSFGGHSRYNVTTRLTALPVYEDGGARLVHLGLSYSHKFRSNDTIRYRQRPEAHLSPVRFADTRDLPTDGIDLISPEVAVVLGPFSVQGEYTRAFVDGPGSADPEFEGWYVYVSYFLTGEHRRYKTSGGAFDRVSPANDFLSGEGCGAWEVAARYSRLDLNDASSRGGRMDDFTAGINWYLNPNVRVMANYVYSDRDPIGSAQIVESRFQVDF